MRSNSGYIYLLIDELANYLKIGLTTKDNINERISSIRTSSPYEIYILSSFRSYDVNGDEKMLHKKFNEFRHKGEWFRFDYSIIEEFEIRGKPEIILDIKCNRYIDKCKLLYPRYIRESSEWLYQKAIEEIWPLPKVISGYTFDDDIKLTFGKYEGKRCNEVPEPYIQWIVDNVSINTLTKLGFRYYENIEDVK